MPKGYSSLFVHHDLIKTTHAKLRRKCKCFLQKAKPSCDSIHNLDTVPLLLSKTLYTSLSDGLVEPNHTCTAHAYHLDMAGLEKSMRCLFDLHCHHALRSVVQLCRVQACCLYASEASLGLSQPIEAG